MKRIGVFTSGGDAPGMNACIRAVVRTALHYKMEVFGINRGYSGMIRGDMYQMTSRDVSNIMQLGGTILQSARSETFRTPSGRRRAYNQLKKAGIEGLVAIGGDGTFKGASLLGQEFGVPIVGVPGTIDNDLFGSDFTLGYDTAVNTAMTCIDNIKDTANSHNRLFFVEVMGRDAGFIALRSGIASGAEAVLIPEAKTNIDDLIKILARNYKSKKSSSIVVVAEGERTGGAFEIADMVKQKVPHYDMRVTVLGHLQRGGRPSCFDRVLASRLGMEAVKALRDGKKDVMVGQIHTRIEYTPFEKACKHNQTISPVMLDMVRILS
ncbi:MAG TPA: 6-phosphofructokinase [Saprospiraceae bacterium]|nr:6-phosphofructokinase [Saprospiraceae bacterium]